MNKKQILESLEAQTIFDIDYHGRKLEEEIQFSKISPREYELNYHRRKLEEAQVLNEVITKALIDELP